MPRHRLERLPQLRQGVEVQHGVVVAMQIQHQIGIHRQPDQNRMQGFHAGLRLERRNRLLQGRTDGAYVQCGIVTGLETLLKQPLQRPVEQADAAQAVVVLAGGKVEAPDMPVEQVLPQPQRVAHGHQHDLRLHAPLRLEPLQPLEQVVRHQRARQLVGMQAGLDVDLAR